MRTRRLAPRCLAEIAEAATQQRLISMSKMVRGIFGAIAVTVSLGAAQLASGSDLTQIGLRTAQSLDQDVNRTAKSDRAAVVKPLQSSDTIAVGLVDQTILVRTSSERLGEARQTPRLLKAPGHKTVVACEPMVSVLTELARQLQPGRCVT